jgi:outer membrane protein assembly factor BamB
MKTLLSILLPFVFLYSCSPADPGPNPTPTPTPTVGKATIFTGATDGVMYAVDASNGDIKWKTPLGDIFLAAAVKYGNGVLFASRNNALAVVDPITGAEQWKAPYNGAPYPEMENTPMINGRYMHVTYASGVVGTHDTTTSIVNGVKVPTFLWAKIIGVTSTRRLSAPAATNGILFVGTDSSIVALDAATGASKWSYQINKGCWKSNPVALNNMVYVYSQEGVLYALNAPTGTLSWKTVVDSVMYGGGGATFASPITWNNTIYVGSGNRVCALDINTGAIKWYSEYPHGGNSTTYASVAIYDGILYANAGNGTSWLSAWDAVTGKLKWEYDAGDVNIYTTPNAADDFVTMVTENGTVHVLNAKTGVLKWKKRIVTGSARIIYSSPTILDKSGVIHMPGEAGQVN